MNIYYLRFLIAWLKDLLILTISAMLRLDLNRIFKIKGIGKLNTYLVSRGHSSTYASHLMTGKIVSISFAKMEQFCIDFKCTPNDLFDFVPDKGNVLPEGHPLWALQKNLKIEEINTLLHSLSMEQIDGIYRDLKGEKG